MLTFENVLFLKMFNFNFKGEKTIHIRYITYDLNGRFK
jgi:hypothetical protein